MAKETDPQKIAPKTALHRLDDAEIAGRSGELEAVSEALEGLSGATARRIVLSRRDGAGIRSAADLAAVPGVGTRRIHRWHADLAFAEDLP